MPGTDTLADLAKQALVIAKKARKHGKSLSGDNYYGNRLAALRADAINSFRQLTSRSAGDSAALAELVETTFSSSSDNKTRLEAVRELTVSLGTTWGQPSGVQPDSSDLFPLTILTQARRGYLVTVGRQMNGCFAAGWYDASAVMMRRLLEIAIIEAFEASGVSGKIKGPDGNYFQLSDLIAAALSEPKWSLSRNTKRYLPSLRDLAHQSAHGRYFTAHRDDLEKLQPACRVVIEEFLHHAKLL